MPELQLTRCRSGRKFLNAERAKTHPVSFSWRVPCSCLSVQARSSGSVAPATASPLRRAARSRPRPSISSRCRAALRTWQESTRITGLSTKTNASSTSYRSSRTRSRTIRVIVVGRVAHPVGRSPRGSICTSVLRPLRLRHVRTSGNDDRRHDSNSCFILSFLLGFRFSGKSSLYASLEQIATPVFFSMLLSTHLNQSCPRTSHADSELTR